MAFADLEVNRLNISHVKRPIKTKLKFKQGQWQNLKHIMFSNAYAHRNLISVLKSLIESTSRNGYNFHYFSENDFNCFRYEQLRIKMIYLCQDVFRDGATEQTRNIKSEFFHERISK